MRSCFNKKTTNNNFVSVIYSDQMPNILLLVLKRFSLTYHHDMENTSFPPLSSEGFGGYGFKSSEWLCKNWHTNLLLTRRDNPHAYGVFPTISQHFKITCSVLARFFFPPFPSSSWILSKLYGFPTYFPNTLSFPILTRAWAHFPVPACSVYSANYIINTCLQSHLSALLRIVLCMSCIG